LWLRRTDKSRTLKKSVHYYSIPLLKLSKSHIDNITLTKKNNGNKKMFMQNNSYVTRTHNPGFTSLRPCPLDQCYNW